MSALGGYVLAYGSLCCANFFGCAYLRVIVFHNQFFCDKRPVERQNVTSYTFAWSGHDLQLLEKYNTLILKKFDSSALNHKPNRHNTTSTKRLNKVHSTFQPLYKGAIVFSEHNRDRPAYLEPNSQSMQKPIEGLSVLALSTTNSS
jgi:hypothetical protein